MKKKISVLFLFASISILYAYRTSTPPAAAKIATSKNELVATTNIPVLELFTSQGCSSCPPADRLLGKYADMKNVIVLSYHVDYWNRLGWKDPFSSAAFSQRQKEYARLFKLSGVYTPQLVINGTTEMVGSNANKIVSVLKKEQTNTPTTSLQITEVTTDSRNVTIKCTVNGNENNLMLNLALAQNKISTNIKSGENTGINSTNYNVVRNFKSMAYTGKGPNTFSIEFGYGINKKDLKVVAFLQNSSTYKIVAAAQSSL